MTIHNTQTSGTIAIAEGSEKQHRRDGIFDLAAKTDRVKRRSLDRLVERGGGHVLTFPPAIARAAALTMNVSANNTKPAAM